MRLLKYDNDSMQEADELASGAMWVDPDFVALPTCAGGLRPIDILPEVEGAMLRDMKKTVLQPRDRWPHILPRSCHRVRPGDEVRLQQKLLRLGVCKLVPKWRIPTDPVTGLPISGGFVCVPKPSKPGQPPRPPRLISDRRPQNSMERILHWARLPRVAQLRP